MEKGTFYGAFVLYGPSGTCGSTDCRLVQFCLRAGSLSRFPDDFPGGFADDGTDDEHGTIVLAQEFYLDLWHVVLSLL